MKNKNKKVIFYLVLFLCVGFFGFGEASYGESSVIVSSVQIYGDSSANDFVELYNPTCSEINISKWKLRLRNGSDSATESSIRVFPDNLTIPAKGYFLWANSSIASAVGADEKSTASLSENYSIALINSNDVLVDALTWGVNKRPFAEKYAYLENPAKYQSLRRDSENNLFLELNYSPSNSLDTNSIELKLCPVPDPIPEEESEDESDIVTEEKNIYLNEILPNPSGKEEEYIEIFNNSADDVDLVGWILRDGSKTGKYVFPKDSILESGEFLAIYKKDFKFALNDSGTESVRLLDPAEKEVSVVTYSGAKDGLSFGLDESKWRWSKHLTPSAENVFDDSPSFKVEKDNEVYRNFPANFNVSMKKYKKNKTKITWNFGDGHKSYKKTTTHKYEKKGKYNASVKIFNGSEEVIKNFKVEVRDFPKYDVEIIAANPNPEGSDTNLETLTVRNNSKKKVNLQNWSIATGDKKLTNHPIALKTILKPKETLKITRNLSKFTLNNQKAKVELRYPNGKVASKMQYDKKTKTIAEGEILEKTKLGWVWKNTAPVTNVPQDLNVPRETNLLAEAPESEQNVERVVVLGESVARDDVSRVEHLVGEKMLDYGQSKMKNKKDFKIILASFAYTSPTEQASEIINQTRIKPAPDLANLFF